MTGRPHRGKMFVWGLIGLIGMAASVSAGLDPAEDAAMVVDSKGLPPVFSNPPRAGQEVRLFDFLNTGDRIKLSGGSVLVLNYFASSTREEIKGPGEIEIGSGKSRLEGQALARCESVGYIPPQVKMTAQNNEHVAAVPIRGSGDRPMAAIVPMTLDRTAVRDRSLRFRWQPVPQADLYRLVVVDSGRQVMFETGSDKTAVDWPVASLTPEQEYQWVVRAERKGRPLAEGSGVFRLLGPETREEIAVTEKAIRTRFGDSGPEGRAALAGLYQKYQLNDEARAVWRSLLQEWPDNMNLVLWIKRLRDNYQKP